MDLDFSIRKILGGRMRMNCRSVCLLFLFLKLFRRIISSAFMDRKLEQGRAVVICCINKYSISHQGYQHQISADLHGVSSGKGLQLL